MDQASGGLYYQQAATGVSSPPITTELWINQLVHLLSPHCNQHTHTHTHSLQLIRLPLPPHLRQAPPTRRPPLDICAASNRSPRVHTDNKLDPTGGQLRDTTAISSSTSRGGRGAVATVGCGDRNLRTRQPERRRGAPSLLPSSSSRGSRFSVASSRFAPRS